MSNALIVGYFILAVTAILSFLEAEDEEDWLE
jgi:hypothetical protein